MNYQDFEYLQSNLDSSDLFGSDTSIANIFLLQEKYNTELKIYKNILFRYYYGDENRTGYGFPIPMKSVTSSEKTPENWLKTALEYIFEDSRIQNRPAAFCLLTSSQKTLINNTLTQFFPNRTVNWKTNRNDCDYIYLRENLAELPGSKYQKKRNHISRFYRIYDTDWEFKEYPENDISKDILYISQKWYEEKQGDEQEDLRLEHESIKFALENHELLKLRGGVLYIHGEPAAMTLAAPISPDVLDVIYEKSYGEFERNGAYAVINQQFARRCSSFLYLNREEDMGVEGLRKAKLSYKPEMILDKFYGIIEHN